MSDKGAELAQTIESILTAFESVPIKGLGAYLRIEAGLIALVALEDICGKMDSDPYPLLQSAFTNISRLPGAFVNSISHMRENTDADLAGPDGIEHTANLFEAAWTHFDDKTYDHSVGLVESRLGLSGFDRNYFKGKVCFDGGCGTGRLSIAMAKAGAKEVVAADIGGESLEYLKKTCRRYGLTNIRVIAQDITNLAEFSSDSFDFVASNGVLHHTMAPDRGIIEHFRITRPGGVFWIYLYGAGGFYWEAYDRLKVLVRDLQPRMIREILSQMNIRQGLIYTYLDNMLAPRVYYRLEPLLALLGQHAALEYAHAKGRTAIDDTNKLLATHWGKDMFGPDGEIRIAISKKSTHVSANSN